MRLFRRGMRSSRNIEPSPEFTAQLHEILKGYTHEQFAAIARVVQHSEAAINRKLEAIMHTLEDTLAAVQAETTSENSIIALLAGIKKQLNDALAGQMTPSQQNRIDAIFNQATANKTAIDTAVNANTDGGPATGTGIATSVTVASSLNPANAGDAISLSAALTPASAGANPPSGTITFFDGSTSLGSTTMDSTGVAALASSAFAGGNLAVGDHNLHATYGGDALYASSTSADLVQTVATAATVGTPSVAQPVPPVTVQPAPIPPGPSPTPPPNPISPTPVV
jgi:hypothetical protein